MLKLKLKHNPDAIHIDTEGDQSRFSVIAKPEVTFRQFITVSRGGKILGEVEAKFDFSKMPVEFHQLALQVIPTKGTNICQPVYQPKPVKDPEPRSVYETELKPNVDAFLNPIGNMLRGSMKRLRQAFRIKRSH